MNQRGRKLLLYGTIAVFVIISPIIIAYSLGYGFDWENKRPVLTGGFYFYSTPKKADIYINEKLKGKTPAFVKRIIPGYHQIKVEKQGYYPWEKNLKIDSQLVTEVKDILLIPIEPKIEIIENILPKNFSLDEFANPEEEQQDSAFYIEKTNNIIYKTDNEKSIPEQISIAPLPDNKTYEIIVSEDNEKIAAIGDKTLYLFNQQTRIFEEIKNNVNSVQFSKNSSELLYSTNNEIWAYNLDSESKELVTRSSQPIKQAIWRSSMNKHIIFATDTNIKIIEIDNRDKRNMFNIAELKADQISYSAEDEKIYLISDNKLISISLK